MARKAESTQDKTLRTLRQEIDEFLDAYLPGPSTEIGKSSAKVVHDALWGTLRLEPDEVTFLDTPLIQRLRHIHQTGCSFFTYPSTTHSRFEHTLGVMLQLQRLGEALKKEVPTDERLSWDDIKQMRLGALFHDVGHGPFSHTSEGVYRNLPQFEALASKSPNAKPHEVLSNLILTSDVFNAFYTRVCDLYEKTNVVKELASYIVCQVTDPPKPYKRDLLNGPFDADKLDYLFRDSHFSGLPLSVDLDRLWYTARIAKAHGEDRLAVTHTGATALEQILFSKMVLFTTVYQHHKVRACDCMFAGIIEYMQSNGIPMKLRQRKLTWESPIDYLWLTDGEFLSFGFETKDENLHDLIHNLFFRRFLKRAMIISRRTLRLKEKDDRWDLLQRHAKDSPESAKARREIANDVWKRAKKPCLLGQVWLDLPELPHLRAANETFVLPEKDAKPVPLNDLFPTAKWATQYGMHKWRGHVFCPPECREEIGKAARDVFEEMYDIEVLPEAFQWCKIEPPARQ